MSRSYKKTPYCGDNKGKENKRIANHKVRSWLKSHPNITLQGNKYKHIYETWDICDYCAIMTWEEYWIKCWDWYLWRKKYREEKEPNYEEEWKNWNKTYKRK